MPLPAPRLNSKSGEIPNETHENQWYLVTGHSKKAQLNNWPSLGLPRLGSIYTPFDVGYLIYLAPSHDTLIHMFHVFSLVYHVIRLQVMPF